MNWMTLVSRQCLREWLLKSRQLRTIVNSCLFFFMVLIFFPLTLPPEVSVLRMITPGLVWIAALLAFFLSSIGLFQEEYEDGVMEQWLISPCSLNYFIIPKIGMHWILTLLPFLLFCPVLALLFSLSIQETMVVMTSLLFGTPTILFLCALAAAFSLGIQQKGVVMALVLLPLTIPVMIFGSGVISASMHELPVQGHLALLLACSITSVAFLPYAIGTVIRMSCAD